MAKPKGLSREDKMQQIADFLIRKRTVFTLKYLEKASSSGIGMHPMTMKELIK
ncbi:hypothetical protein KIPB_015597, partial [Kipferlia bialata]|eukprot:g15597.t1